MKILHICLGNYFIDGMSYQENMLTKAHKRMGLDVEIIASCQTYDENGDYAFDLKKGTYRNEDDIPVTRIAYKKKAGWCYKLRCFEGLSEALEASNPDFMFIHNVQFYDIRIVVDYLKRHPNIRVYADNHADYTNTGTNAISWLINKIIWKRCAQLINPYITKFYGVLPVRVDFLRNEYHLPAEKCKLLVMGADDEAVKAAAMPQVKKAIRARYGIAEDDFLIVTGGKIDAFKTQTLLLMQAVLDIQNPNVKLMVFGSVTPELKERVQALADGVKVQYIGWVQAKDSYDYFAAADLAVFPGRHSVFWEQVVAQGIPMLVKDWPGTHHVDLGGNVKFLTKDSAEEIQEWIIRLSDRSEAYQRMKDVATDKGMYAFSYARIARDAIEI